MATNILATRTLSPRAALRRAFMLTDVARGRKTSNRVAEYLNDPALREYWQNEGEPYVTNAVLGMQFCILVFQLIRISGDISEPPHEVPPRERLGQLFESARTRCNLDTRTLPGFDSVTQLIHFMDYIYAERKHPKDPPKRSYSPTVDNERRRWVLSTFDGVETAVEALEKLPRSPDLDDEIWEDCPCTASVIMDGHAPRKSGILASEQETV
jgi:hypothetical protein